MKTSIAFLLFVSPFLLYGKADKNSQKKAASARVSGACIQTTAQADLAINNVRARVLNGGDLWWDPVAQIPYYEVPYGSNKIALWAGSIWIGGLDMNNQIKAAAQTYRQFGSNDFWAGPLSVNGSIVDVSTATCNAYDQIWSVTRQEVWDFVNGQPATTAITSWPGNGNVANGELPLLAPFFDSDNDGVYSYQSGDYPNFNLSGGPTPTCNGYLKGDKALWWVFNDAGNIKTETMSDVIGLEIRAMAFAFSSPGNPVNDATFYEYQVINRSAESLFETYFGAWTDCDLGNAIDDYVGCNVALGLGYCYNGDANDEGADGYGLNPPAVGIDFFQGPVADANDGIDNDRDGVTDEVGEEIHMSKFIYYANANSTPMGNPAALDDYYQYLSGLQLNGMPVTYGGAGMNAANPACSFMFPDNTDPAFTTSWTMMNSGIPPNDMRFLQSAGKFTLSPGEVNYITTGVVWARATSGGPMASVSELFLADAAAQSLFDNCFITALDENANENTLLYPNPVTSQSVLLFNNDGKDYSLTIYDLKGNKICHHPFKDNKAMISRKDFSSGVYIYVIEGRQKFSGRFTVL